MSQTAAHWVDHVIPHGAVRQWVRVCQLRLPIALRPAAGGAARAGHECAVGGAARGHAPSSGPRRAHGRRRPRSPTCDTAKNGSYTGTARWRVSALHHRRASARSASATTCHPSPAPCRSRDQQGAVGERRGRDTQPHRAEAGDHLSASRTLLLGRRDASHRQWNGVFGAANPATRTARLGRGRVISPPPKARRGRSRHLTLPTAAPPDQSACLRKNAGISISSMPLLASASTFAAACVRLVRHTLGVLRPS